MHPQQPWRFRARDPRGRGGGGLARRTLDSALAAGGHAIVVNVESRVETEGAAKRKTADERRGRVAAGVKRKRESRLISRYDLAVVANAVAPGEKPGHERYVRRKRQRNRDHRRREADSRARERVDVRRRVLLRDPTER